MAQIIAGFFFYGTFNDRPTHSIMCCLTQVKNTISRFRRQCLSVTMLGLTCLLVVMCLCAQFWRFIKKSIVLPHAIPECNLYIFQYLKNAFWLYNCVPSHIMCCWSMWKMWFVIIIIWKVRIGSIFDRDLTWTSIWSKSPNLVYYFWLFLFFQKALAIVMSIVTTIFTAFYETLFFWWRYTGKLSRIYAPY